MTWVIWSQPEDHQPPETDGWISSKSVGRRGTAGTPAPWKDSDWLTIGTRVFGWAGVSRMRGTHRMEAKRSPMSPLRAGVLRATSLLDRQSPVRVEAPASRQHDCL